MAKMAKIYKDDEMTIKKDDIDAIRLRPGYIIGSIGESGVLHLCKEIIDNNRDECFKKESPGDTITIEITDKYIISRDNGRGIPTKLLRIIHETSNAGSNMTRKGGSTAGENGIGTTAYTALASELVVTTLRPQEKKKLTLIYREGQFIEEKLEEYTGKDHGMITMFKPSKEILNVDYIPVNALKEWLQEFDYTLPEDIKMVYTINGEKFETHHKSIRDFFNERIPENQMMSPIISFDIAGDIIEVSHGENIPRTFTAKIGYVYTSPEYKGEEIKQSWMNMIHTIQNGTHMNGAINGLVRFMTEKVVRKKKALEDEDIKRDILAHLQVVVIATCNFGIMFSNQSKHTVFPASINKRFTEAVYDAFENGCIPSTSIAEYTDVIIANNRVRHEGEKARVVDALGKKKNKWEKPKTYIPCSSQKTKEGKELYIVEGLSAGGGLRAARDPRYQAILQCRGKSLNTWNEDLGRVFKSDVWANLINILECGIGVNFDIKKLKFDKIIIATDADIDGYHIRVITSSFFAKYLPEIILEGKLYIAEPPLYKLLNKDSKTFSYVTSQREYIQSCLNTLDDIMLSFNKGKQTIKASIFVEESFNYLNILKDVSQTKLIDRYLLEHIANALVKYKTAQNFIDHIDEWLKAMFKVYKEIGFDRTTNQITATINLVDQYVFLDDELVESLSYITEVLSKYDLLVRYTSQKRKIDNQTTLARFFEEIEDCYPVIKDRYKGLGSSAAIVSKETIMDPRTRRLIRVDISDIAMLRNQFDMLVGKGKDDILARKELIQEYMDTKFSKEDIDN